jgi:aspartyl-tRNA(Asn)/glutamyl-tRNA(Gln) amidotransferase subunit A
MAPAARGDDQWNNMTRRSFTSGVLATAAALAADTDDLCWSTLEEASERMRRKEVSSVELTRACLQRIEKLNPRLNAFITVTRDQALAQAREADAELRAGHWRGPLHGIPAALKDLIDTAGIRTTAGSAHYKTRVPEQDAAVVQRLKDAGAVLVGKTNLDEFAYNYTAETSHFGASRNPWDPKRSPGGSSGGSAVAVAAGMCFAALGSDTGGSIRLPAALCGVTGFKPTYGRVSTEGAAPLAWSLDHIGPFARTARDAGLVFDAIAKGSAPEGVPRAGSLRLGAPRAMFYEGLDGEVEQLVADALRTLGGLTSGVRDVQLPPLPMSPQAPDLPLTYLRIIGAEAHTFHEEMMKRSPELYHPGTRKSIGLGDGLTVADYIRARLEMDRLRAGSAALFDGVELLVTPAAPAAAFELGSPAGLIFLRNFAPWNLYGLPSIVVPCGFTRAGLPAGIQITGPMGNDKTVLAAAAAFQGATGWHRRRPPT